MPKDDNKRKIIKMTITIHGIKNCDTMKKAFKWLDDHGVAYEFHDYKKVGVDMNVLARAMDAHGWEHVINRKGITWRKIPENERDNMSRDQAEILADAKPSVIKRPLIAKGDIILLGFDTDLYKEKLL
jgi:Spx/MgsR family transcriptional regulator